MGGAPGASSLGLQALTELRSLLGVLAAAPDQAPSLRGLPALIDESLRAGLTVHLTVTDPPDGRPDPGPAVQYVVYRIVQEALTTIHKHAPSADVNVSAEIHQDGLHLAVVNSSGGTGSEPQLPSGGHGLASMRTRATDLGGTLSAGPTPDVGFRRPCSAATARPGRAVRAAAQSSPCPPEGRAAP
ncbi:sensor histidine kinase [Kitasatospora sp. NPDC101176]|uniref:sensor histidine kinase n=1 Tax=Kitasatospora sp. NPDC101176 TaxID=3364099 RepID=UPI0037FCF8F8